MIINSDDDVMMFANSLIEDLENKPLEEPFSMSRISLLPPRSTELDLV